jgi:hypothetical protein
MSSEDDKHKTSEQFSGGVPPVAPTTSSAGGAPPTPRAADKSLSTLEKIKRFFFSKEEWEAYLLERLEEENRKKGLAEESPNLIPSLRALFASKCISFSFVFIWFRFRREKAPKSGAKVLTRFATPAPPRRPLDALLSPSDHIT